MQLIFFQLKMFQFYYFQPDSKDDRLQFIHMTTITRDECNDQFKHVSHNKRIPMNDNTLCAKSDSSSEDLCYGDSGGPFIVNNHLIGIVSWGKGCGMGLPDGFTRVSTLSGWIRDILSSQAKDCKIIRL